MKNAIIISASLVITAIIIGGSLIYIQNNKQASIERQQEREIESKREIEVLRIAEERKKKDLEEESANEAKEALEGCIARAFDVYNNLWSKECEERGLLSSECKEITKMDSAEYINKNLVKEDIQERIRLFDEYQEKKENCSCSLPQYKADAYEENLKMLKDDCYKKNPLK